MTYSAEKDALAVLLDHVAEPCGEYRPNFRADMPVQTHPSKINLTYTGIRRHVRIVFN